MYLFIWPMSMRLDPDPHSQLGSGSRIAKSMRIHAAGSGSTTLPRTADSAGQGTIQTFVRHGLIDLIAILIPSSFRVFL